MSRGRRHGRRSPRKVSSPSPRPHSTSPRKKAPTADDRREPSRSRFDFQEHKSKIAVIKKLLPKCRLPSVVIHTAREVTPVAIQYDSLVSMGCLPHHLRIVKGLTPEKTRYAMDLINARTGEYTFRDFQKEYGRFLHKHYVSEDLMVDYYCLFRMRLGLMILELSTGHFATIKQVGIHGTGAFLLTHSDEVYQVTYASDFPSGSGTSPRTMRS